MTDIREKLLNYSKEALVDYLLDQPMPISLDILQIKELELKRKALQAKAEKLQQQATEALYQNKTALYYELFEKGCKINAQIDAVFAQTTQIWSDRQTKRELAARKTP